MAFKKLKKSCGINYSDPATEDLIFKKEEEADLISISKATQMYKKSTIFIK